MLVSPAERPPFPQLGTVSSVPETYGADFMWFSAALGRVGVQRKEIKDLVASLRDDRVQREIIQMKGLDTAIWLIEGQLSWNSDGRLMGVRSEFTRNQWLGLNFSLLSKGFWILQSSSIQESMILLGSLEKWSQKEKHSTLNTRTGPQSVFGTPDVYEWRIHFLQGLPGIGYEKAKLIVDQFGGLPLRMTRDLTEVKGIGKKIAEKIEEVFENGDEI